MELFGYTLFLIVMFYGPTILQVIAIRARYYFRSHGFAKSETTGTLQKGN